MLSQKQPDGKWHPIAFGSCELKGGGAKYHSSKLEFLALKWAITEQFREYLQYRLFTMLMDNNPLTYILTTPNLDALGHRWVAALASYNMTIKYLKGSDNKVADALSQIETRLDLETVTELLNHAKGGAPRAEAEDIRIIKEEERADQEVILRTTQLARQDKKFHNLCTEDWRQAQQMDPVIPHVLEWLRLLKNDRTRLKDFLQGKVSEADCRAYGLREKDFKRRDHIPPKIRSPEYGGGSSDTSLDTQVARAIEAVLVTTTPVPDEVVASTSAAGDMRRVELTPLPGLSQQFTLQMEREIQKQIQEQSRKLVQEVLHQSANRVMPPPSSEAARASLRQCFQMALAAPCPTSAASPESEKQSAEEPAQHSLADLFTGINPPPPEVLKESCPVSQSSRGRTATRSEPPKANYPPDEKREGAIPTPEVKLNQSVAALVVPNPPGTFPISEVDTPTTPLLSLPGSRRLQNPRLNSSQ